MYDNKEDLIRGLKEIKAESDIDFDALLIKVSFGAHYTVRHLFEKDEVLVYENGDSKDPGLYDIYKKDERYILLNKVTRKKYIARVLTIGCLRPDGYVDYMSEDL